MLRLDIAIGTITVTADVAGIDATLTTVGAGNHAAGTDQDSTGGDELVYE